MFQELGFRVENGAHGNKLIDLFSHSLFHTRKCACVLMNNWFNAYGRAKAGHHERVVH